MNVRPWLAGLALAAGLVTGQTAAADAVATLKGFLARVDTLEAAFEQSLFDEDNLRIETSGGRFYLDRPGRFRWSYDTPYVQEIVADGERVWVYDSELEQVTEKPLGAAIGDSPARLLSTDQDLDAHFTVRDLGRQGPMAWVELVPRDAEEGAFRALRLGFAGDDLRQMELADNFGQTTVLRFSAVRVNPDLAPGLFRFVPPPGVDVVRDAPDGAEGR